MQDDADLLPCPHCGANAKSYHRLDDTGWSNTDWICCDAGDNGISPECGAQTCLFESRAEAAAAWNRRTNRPIVAEQQGGGKDLQAVIGYFKTHWDCDCGEINEEEGDATGDVVVCRSCGSSFTVIHT